ncbi:ABC transporter ATP-binding protein [Methanoregula sp.]|jgi:iron complex transport system ATP-binding protein|uniref:ABC transporter ATP-binding protein n=1 Tax=Methanoregula sp. TaxID=2052170 RepID=UPI002632929B|nr:ABC transporter ATP-binding protein [Methanoregula sp.]MDD5144376.1 ABC transporter ATP-binding protein [Methanoregula sp.]
MTKMLTVNDLKFMYRNRDVLQQIGFSIEQGQVIAVLGPNGVGKTTLLKCLNRILKPREGTVMLDNENLLDLDTMDIARRVGYVPQRVETGRLTAFDAVLLGRRPHIGWDVVPRDLAIVDAVFRKLGMEALRLSYIDEMSGGELQKVAIARALVQEPRVLLLDEPTSNLDMKNQVDILTTIREVVRDHGIAAIMTMHDLNQALRFADTFIFIKNGRVHIHGSQDIVTPSVIEDVYGLPVMIGELGGVRCVIPGACKTT